jgi:hypothetical protein
MFNSSTFIQLYAPAGPMILYLPSSCEACGSKRGPCLGTQLEKTYVLSITSKSREHQVTRVNSTNVLCEGLRIGEIGHQMNSKVKLVEIGVCRK